MSPTACFDVPKLKLQLSQTQWKKVYTSRRIINNNWSTQIKQKVKSQILQSQSPTSQNQSGMNNFDGVLKNINNSLKYIVTIIAVWFLRFNFNVQVCWVLLGSLMAVLMNKILKQIINQSRPSTSRKTDPGMPSSHASVTAYFSAVISSLVFDSKLSNYYFIILFVELYAVFVAWIRVRLGFHTPAQVAVGFGVGTWFGIFWGQIGIIYMLNVLQNRIQLLQFFQVFVYVGGFVFVVMSFLSERQMNKKLNVKI
eukprot:TRINITY_DN17774_c0_g1_i1.p2 TRINITY_DN17774_c0_g1~~TRINITY_DN17774_c0_g1_i1.p2  ORF type:complete len:254 (-),score=15.62 TRINITY_DN17774_c0_g1_i1:163-924(-)